MNAAPLGLVQSPTSTIPVPETVKGTGPQGWYFPILILVPVTAANPKEMMAEKLGEERGRAGCWVKQGMPGRAAQKRGNEERRNKRDVGWRRRNRGVKGGQAGAAVRSCSLSQCVNTPS